MPAGSRVFGRILVQVWTQPLRPGGLAGSRRWLYHARPLPNTRLAVVAAGPGFSSMTVRGRELLIAGGSGRHQMNSGITTKGPCGRALGWARVAGHAAGSLIGRIVEDAVRLYRVGGLLGIALGLSASLLLSIARRPGR